MRKPDAGQAFQAGSFLLCVYLALQLTRGLDGTEFSGGWLTGPVLSMADSGTLLFILAISLVTSKGAHGVPGSAIVILAATLSAVPAIPAIGLVLVLSIDWFVGMARALGNLIGNCVATVVIGAWEGDLDVTLAKRVLSGDVTVDIIDDAAPEPVPAE